MKLAVSTYSYMKAFKSGQISVMDIIPHAKKTGYECIDIASNDAVVQRLKDFKRQASDEGMPIVHYSHAANFLNEDFKGEVEMLKRQLDIAAEFGAPIMRHDTAHGFPAGYVGPRSFDAALPRIIEGCALVTEYAKSLGLKTVTENHGRFAQDSARVEKVICGVNNPNFGALVDMGNFLCADEDPLKAVAIMAPYAFHVHAKDFFIKPATARKPLSGWIETRAGNYLRGAMIGHGQVPVLECLRLIKNAGYDGWVALEFEGMEDSLMGVEQGYLELRRDLDELEK